jgi:diacylglycerol kinase family enzyme
MLVTVQNQKSLGKRFILASTAKNNDGYFEVCLLSKHSVFRDLMTLSNVVKGLHVGGSLILKSNKVLTISTLEKTYFMADGELLDYSDVFAIRMYHQAIKVLY